MIANIRTVYPTSLFLADHIYCLYFFEDTGTAFRSLHYSFPHTCNALSVYSNGFYHIGHQKILIDGNSNGLPFAILQGKRTEPLLVDLNGDFSRFTILFKPLGINHFINRPLGTIMGADSSLFTEWHSVAYDDLVKKMFTAITLDEKLSLLEEFLKSIYRSFILTPIETALNYLCDFNEERRIEEVAALIKMPVRTFNRLFRVHIGISPAPYRQIARFRHSLENKLFDDQLQKLTTVAYQSNFYDQAYFNKMYKQLSGTNPKKFFQTVKQIGNSHLVFRYL